MAKVLREKINKSLWWHVKPRDIDAYKKRGKFLASTYLQADFYGRPNDEPEKVRIANPIFGFSEEEILNQLFPFEGSEIFKELTKDDDNDPDWYKTRIEMDAKMCRRAKKMGFDSIVLMGRNGRRYLERNRKPNSIELNLLYV